MRRYGGHLVLIIPFTYTVFIIGSFAIMGLPFLTGFFSKELIIDLGFKRFILDLHFIIQFVYYQLYLRVYILLNYYLILF